MSERAQRRASRAAALQQRVFDNGTHKVIAQRQPDGAWSVAWQTSMGVEKRRGAFESDEKLNQWLTTVGAQQGYREVPSAERLAQSMTDGQFLYLSTEIAKWQSRCWEHYDGPNDPDFRLAFFTRFGITVDVWQAAQRNRGLSVDAEENNVREELMRQYAAEIDAVIAEESREAPSPTQPDRAA